MARINFRRPTVWVPALLGVLFVGLLVFRAMQESAPVAPTASVEDIRAEQGVPVIVAEVERGPLAVWRTYSGNVSGVQEALVRARSGDEIVSVEVAVGDRVSRGQLLVRQTGEGSAARVRQAQAAQAQAQRTVDRIRPLHEAGAISDQEWEQTLTQLELANADYEAAADVLRLSSPLAGVVTEVMARPGMIPSAGDPLVRVADLSELVVYLRVGADEVREIREGQPARIAGTTVQGEVRRVALQADPVSRLVEVVVAFPPGAGLVAGTLATVEIQVASLDDTLIVPRSAVQTDEVWVVDDEGIVTRRSVQVQLQAADQVGIQSGVEQGERVVVSGGSLLSDGTHVQVVESPTGVS